MIALVSLLAILPSSLEAQVKKRSHHLSQTQADRALTAAEIFKQCQPAILSIRTTLHEDGKVEVGAGTGFAYIRSDLVITAFHVIQG
ncbi:MAG TPA: hypothetical protein VMI31_13270, partial [Fimbriimonadaceae bacterium]|nr:hypothetical protein [Fimbriimonadaceae bacterium]